MRRQTFETITLPAVVGTWLTGFGHTVEIIESNAQGIVINDFYGSCRGKDNYLRHGECRPIGGAKGAPMACARFSSGSPVVSDDIAVPVAAEEHRRSSYREA